MATASALVPAAPATRVSTADVFRNGRFEANDWPILGDADAFPSEGQVIVSFARALDLLSGDVLGNRRIGVIVGPGVVDAAPKPRPGASTGKDAALTLAPTPAKADTPGAQTTLAQAPLDAPCGGPASRIQRSFRGTVPQPAPSRGRSAAPALPELRLRADYARVNLTTQVGDRILDGSGLTDASLSLPDGRTLLKNGEPCLEIQ